MKGIKFEARWPRDNEGLNYRGASRDGKKGKILRNIYRKQYRQNLVSAKISISGTRKS